MIIDDREGSGDLLPMLKRRGVEAEHGRLDFGDISIVGRGADDAPMAVGVEVKKVLDVLKCIIDGRFAGHQLPGLVQSYQIPFLLIEGRYRACMNTGALQISGQKGYWHDACVGGRRFMYRDLDSWLMTIEFRAGVRVVRAYDRHETAAWLADLWHWWTDKAYDEHRSHLAFDSSARTGVTLVKPNLVRRVAKELPGIGWERSGAVAANFSTVAELVTASEMDWRNIEGVGKVLADRIVKAINGA